LVEFIFVSLPAFEIKNYDLIFKIYLRAMAQVGCQYGAVDTAFANAIKLDPKQRYEVRETYFVSLRYLNKKK
jgi:hypothetical protein